MKLTELKLLCRGCGLKANGKKSELIKRLQDYIEQQQQELLQHRRNITTINNDQMSPEKTHSASTTSLSTAHEDASSFTGHQTLCSTNDVHKNSCQKDSRLHNVSIDIVNNVDSSHNHAGMYQFLNLSLFTSIPSPYGRHLIKVVIIIRTF